jgi:alpha/beta superfamily hydrolase
MARNFSLLSARRAADLRLYRSERLFIDGPVGRLQALYHPGEPGLAAVVVCHPHPQHGGTMHNKVVYWMGRAFEETGCSVLRFNFRGVEQSDGSWDGGHGEVDDVAAMLDWMHKKQAASPLWLAGFSFGCYAGLLATRYDKRVSRLFAVAPAVNLWSFDFMAGSAIPLTVIAGTVDDIVPFDAARNWAASQASATFHSIVGAGHFFKGHLEQMQYALLQDIQPVISDY